MACGACAECIVAKRGCPDCGCEICNALIVTMVNKDVNAERAERELLAKKAQK